MTVQSQDVALQRGLEAAHELQGVRELLDVVIVTLPLDRLEDVLLDREHVGDIGAQRFSVVFHGYLPPDVIPARPVRPDAWESSARTAPNVFPGWRVYLM